MLSKAAVCICSSPWMVHKPYSLHRPCVLLSADCPVTLSPLSYSGVEFTKLGSFGNVFAFGTNLVNSMDRSFLLRMRKAMPADGEPIQVAKLLDAKDTR